MRNQGPPSSPLRNALFASLLAAATPGCNKGAPGLTVSVEPAVVRLTDRIYPENEYVSAEFRIVNPLGKPVTVTELSTQCGCTTAVVGGGKRLPLSIAPNQSCAFVLKAFGTAKPEPLQTFVAHVSTECDGRPLADATASLQFQVEDPLRAFPDRFVAGGLPLRPAKKRLSLVTMSTSTATPKPELKVSDPELIEAQLYEPEPGSVGDERFKTHYTVEITVTPKGGASSVTGTVSVISAGRVIRDIPVQCAFKVPFTLSLAEIHVDGSPGDQVGKDVYYEAHDAEWRDLEVAHKPDNVHVEVDQFDKTTQRLRLTITVPSHENLPAAADGDCIVLKSKKVGHGIRLPVRYDPRNTASSR